MNASLAQALRLGVRAATVGCIAWALACCSSGENDEPKKEHTQPKDPCSAGPSGTTGQAQSALKGSDTYFRWAVGTVAREKDLVGCTGTLIAPRAVLTAAHCVQGSQNFKFYIWRDLSGKTVSADSARYGWGVTHPQYKWNEDSQGKSTDYDIALVHLEKPIYKHQPIPLLYDYEPGTNDCNCDGNVLALGGGPDHDRIRSAAISVELDRNGRDLRPNIAVAQGLDSGGPFLIERDDRKWYLIGVMWGGAVAGDYVKASATRITSPIKDWIIENIKSNIEPPSWYKVQDGVVDTSEAATKLPEVVAASTNCATPATPTQ